MRHLLSIEGIGREDMEQILSRATFWKQERGRGEPKLLAGQSWAMIFTKPSTRTRVSFEVGIYELGGRPIYLNASDLQLGRGEPIKDTARVLGRMVHGAVIRTYAQQDVEEFAQYSGIPTVNALTDQEHPCQILTDIFTIQEKLGMIQGKIVCFIGDGACNVPCSWIFAAGKLGFELRIAAPPSYQPSKEILQRAGGNVRLFTDPLEAARGADVLYTDVWISMGREAEAQRRLQELSGYQINRQVVQAAKPGALVMHCLPAYRGKEITEEVFEEHQQTIFDQAENRLHVQKAILEWMVKE